jgi:hypothetical protein
MHSQMSADSYTRTGPNATVAAPGLRRLVTGLSPRRPGFYRRSVHVGFVVDKVALGQGFSRELRFSPVNFILLVLHYLETRTKLILFITGLHNKAESCGGSLVSAAGPFTKKVTSLRPNKFMEYTCTKWHIFIQDEAFTKCTCNWVTRVEDALLYTNGKRSIPPCFMPVSVYFIAIQ